MTPPLTNTQLELLKAFSRDLSEQDLSRLRQVLADFFAGIAVEEADRAWDAQHWDEEKVQILLNTKLRKSSS